MATHGTGTLKLTPEMIAALSQALGLLPKTAEAVAQFATATRNAEAAVAQAKDVEQCLRALNDLQALYTTEPTAVSSRTRTGGKQRRKAPRDAAIPAHLRQTDQPEPDDWKDMGMDDFLDDLDKTPARKTFRQSPGSNKASTKTAPSPPPDYYTVPGNSTTYEARGHLKALGGFWDPDARCWYLPKQARTDVNKVLNEAVIATSLHKNNPDVIAELIRRNVPVTGMPPPVNNPLCWECGRTLYDAADSRAAHFASTGRLQLRQGAVVEERYCGCVERNERPLGAGRPNFRERPF